MSPLLLLTRRILFALAGTKLARERPKIVAVTGSVGKTTTKEAIFAVLVKHYGEAVRRGAGNLNTEEGVPLAILGFPFVPTRWQYPLVLLRAVGAAIFSTPHPQPILVLELAAEKPGDIEYLVELIRPYLLVGVVTTVGPIHLNPGQFSSVEAIAREKGRLIVALPPDGWAVLNRENPYTKRMAELTPAKTVWFADRGVETAKEVATAVGKIFGIKGSEIKEALVSFTRPYGRLHELSGIKGSTVLDDSYNANPMSMEEALRALEQRTGRRVAVLGDMLELGEREKMYHNQIGKQARAASDVLVGVGKRARWYQPTYHFATPLEAASFLKKFVRTGDTVLVKGSQSMRMELVSEALLANSNDSAMLPRQTPAWKAKSFVQP